MDRAPLRTWLAVALALAGTGCATRVIVRSDTTVVSTIVVPVAPPDPLDASALAAPGDPSGRTWVQGHWVYQDAQYLWAPGAWIPTLPGLAFQQPRWVRRESGWAYLPGVWLDDRGVVVSRALDRVSGTAAPTTATSGGVDTSGPVVVAPVQPPVAIVVAPAAPVREEAQVPPPPAADTPVRIEPGAMAMAGPQRGPDLPPVVQHAPPLPPPVLHRGSIFGGVGSGIFHGAPIGVIPGYHGGARGLPRITAPRVSTPMIAPPMAAPHVPPHVSAPPMAAPRVPPVIAPRGVPHIGPMRPPRRP